MKQLFLLVLLVTIVAACSSGSANESAKLQEGISKFEDSLRSHPSSSNIPKMALIEKYLEFQKSFPDDEKAPEYLDKAHMVYSGVGLYVKSAAIAEQIINDYPKYVNRAMVLESQANNYDFFIVPRDSAKVREYYEMFLKENPKVDKEKQDQIRLRLKYNHLTLDEFIAQQAKNAN